MTTLFINSIAGSEIIVILLFVLIFFGAKSIPGMSRSLGRGLRHIRDASQEVQNEIRKTTGDMRSEMNMKRTLDQIAEDVSNPIKSVTRTIEKQALQVEKDSGLKDVIPHQKKSPVPPKNVEIPPVAKESESPKPEEGQGELSKPKTEEQITNKPPKENEGQ